MPTSTNAVSERLGAPTTASPNPTPPSERRRPVPLWQIAVLAGLLLWLYVPTLTHLVAQWMDPYFGHGFFVPLFSAYVVWLEGGRLARLPLQPSWSGLLVLFFAMCLLIVGTMGVELFTARVSLLIALAGLIVLFLGWNFFRALLFPWAFLLLMIPIPAILFSHITLPLQLLASQIGAGVLPWFNVPVFLNGNVLRLADTTLDVAEACSGIRSLTTLFTLAIIYGYLVERRLWVRLTLMFASVPIAIAANSVRIIVTGLIAEFWDPGKAEGLSHFLWGMMIFAISLLMLYALHAVINLLWRQSPLNDNEDAEVTE